MKYLFLFLFINLIYSGLSQRINFYNFNSDSLNNAVLRQLNLYRKSNGVGELVFSNVLYNQITKKNCELVTYMVYNRLCESPYHVKLDTFLQVSNFKNEIGKESLEKIGGSLSIGYPSYKPRILYSENIHWSNDDISTSHFGYYSYDEIAKFVIYRWSISTKGHAETQLRDYSSQGLPGMFACHSMMTQDNIVYVFVNFVTIYRNSSL